MRTLGLHNKKKYIQPTLYSSSHNKNMKKQPLALEYYSKKEFSELFEEFTKNNTLNRQERITTLNLMPKNLK